MKLARIFLAGLIAVLAYGADAGPQYEMAHYIVGFLRKGPNWTAEQTAESRQIQAGHLANINRIAAAGKLTVAGPFEDGGDMRGIFIFQNTTMDEAKALVAADPAVMSGRLVLELHPWYAGAGLRVNAPKGFIDENDVEFAKPGGYPLTLDLRAPVSKAPVPAVIIVHGGGFARGNKRTYVTPLFDVLSSAGFAWFTIN